MSTKVLVAALPQNQSLKFAYEELIDRNLRSPMLGSMACSMAHQTQQISEPTKAFGEEPGLKTAQREIVATMARQRPLRTIQLQLAELACPTLIRKAPVAQIQVVVLPTMP